MVFCVDLDDYGVGVWGFVYCGFDCVDDFCGGYWYCGCVGDVFGYYGGCNDELVRL